MNTLKRLQFSACCPTQYGQFVYICGNIPELGNWNPLKGIRLYTEESFYPIWKSFNTVLVIQNQPIQFKICIVTSKGEFKWENIPQNRVITPQMDAYVKLTINQFEPFQIFPFSQGQQAFRRGIDNILNDLSSDCSSFVQFPSNYRFYEYYNEKHRNGEESEKNYYKVKNTSTYFNLEGSSKELLPEMIASDDIATNLNSFKEFEDKTIVRKEHSFVDQSKRRIQQDKSNSTNSERSYEDHEKQYFGGGSINHLFVFTENDKIITKPKNANIKLKIGNKLRQTSLTKTFSVNSSSNLSKKKNQQF